MGLIALNTAFARATTRLDLTSEKLYTLAPATRKVIESVPADRPILVQAFISPEVPRELAQSRSSLVGLLRQLDQLGGDRVRVRMVSTEKYTPAADEAKRYGVEPQEVQTMVGGKWTR
ncbi:MAG: Gldg family protein, partial [bacterium]